RIRLLNPIDAGREIVVAYLRSRRIELGNVELGRRNISVARYPIKVPIPINRKLRTAVRSHLIINGRYVYLGSKGVGIFRKKGEFFRPISHQKYLLQRLRNTRRAAVKDMARTGNDTLYVSG